MLERTNGNGNGIGAAVDGALIDMVAVAHAAAGIAPAGDADAPWVDHATSQVADEEHFHEEHFREELVGWQEFDRDRAIQAAEETHAAELRKVYREARELLGTIEVKVGREQVIQGGGKGCARTEQKTQWYAMVQHTFGFGPSPREALDQALERFDERHGVAAEGRIGGAYVVEGVAYVMAAPHRTAAEALAAARRIAADRQYLDTFKAYKVPGVLDLRKPAEPAAIKPAAA